MMYNLWFRILGIQLVIYSLGFQLGGWQCMVLKLQDLVGDILIANAILQFLRFLAGGLHSSTISLWVFSLWQPLYGV